MLRTYSRRPLSPFIGVVQVAEMPEARALSLYGRNWEVQYARVSEAQFRTQHPGVGPSRRFALVATIEKGALKGRGSHPFVASDAIRATINQLCAALSTASRPRATWLSGAHGNTTPRNLPPCLLREDWPNEEQRQLCERYLNRLAPRLLMLPDLPRETRRRLEIAACKYVFDVERFHAVHSEVVEDGLLTAARVEATLRRHNPTEKPKRPA